VCESNSLIENLINAYNLTNLIPELVEKKDPPIITKIKNIKYKFESTLLLEIPIFEILLVIESSNDEKLN
tara:strand:+ start:146 stop:355 length:210 start_codon:yes stop_codon:yes gene_type:complete